MAKKDKAQENYFNLHECYDSLEELELALSRIADAASEFYDAVEDANLPPNLAMGMLSMPLHVLIEKGTVGSLASISAMGLLHALGGDR